MVSRFFQSSNLPIDCRANCRHSYLDIAWFGVLSGSALNFLNIYAAHLGAALVLFGILRLLAGLAILTWEQSLYQPR